MPKRHQIAFIAPALFLLLLSMSSPTFWPASLPSSYAFERVHVVPMDAERILRNQTVVVEAGRIVKIGPASEVKIPKGAVHIDGRGKYLMPGLGDMHVHAWNKEDLLLYVANGVTVVRNMNGRPYHLAWRKQIAAGDLLGPTFYTSGPTLYNDPNDPRQVVHDQHTMGYDFIKVYHYLSKEPYQAILEAAKEIGIPVVGHKPPGFSVVQAMQMGHLSQEHMLSYVFPLEVPNSPLRAALRRGQYSFRYTYGAVDIDTTRIPQLAKSVQETGGWNCPTLVAIDRWIPKDEAKAILQQPHMRFVSPATRGRWSGWNENQFLSDSSPALRAQGRRVRRQITKGLHEVGAKLLLGTDAGAVHVEPGFSIHVELQNLVEAGLSPYEALKTGTYNIAEFLNALDEFGTVAEGRGANLILLNTNPLTDVRHVADQAGVMIQDRWFPEATLQQMLEAQVATYKP